MNADQTERPTPSRYFVVIPAAGSSQRMGNPKLLLAFGSQTVIDHVLNAWQSSPVDAIFIVCRHSDTPLIRRCQEHRCSIVRPDRDPIDMKASVQFALDAIEAEHQPQPDDAWFLLPADYPAIDTRVIQCLRNEYERLRIETASTASEQESFQRSTQSVSPTWMTCVVPTYRQRRGHPVLFPWAMVDAVRDIPPQHGLNQLLQRYPVHEVAFDRESILQDMDTPEDYQRLLQQQTRKQPPK